MKTNKSLYRARLLAGVALAGTLGILSAQNASAMSLREAVALTLKSNPEIGQAIANRQALEFELRQGRGLYLPRVDIEGRAGAQRRNNTTTRANGDKKHVFFRREANLTVSQLLFDGFKADAEVERQASKVDAAAYRVYERSEFLGLAVAREYLTILLRRRIVNLTQANVAYHSKILGNIKEGTKSGSISVADRQQAQERLFAARARVAAAREELNASLIAFNRLVGKPSRNLRAPGGIRARLPRSLNAALRSSRKHNPRLKIQKADIDTAYAQLKAANSKFFPELKLEGRARTGKDLDGVRGRDDDLQANVVLRWNLYSGGIDTANRQEQIRRIDEQRMKLHKIHREIEEAVRLSWDRWQQQRRRHGALASQLGSITRLIGSYGEQFRVGRRSLLDLLDTQNTHFNAQIATATARTAVKFAEYRILASTGMLLKTLHLKAPSEARIYARKDAGVPQTPSKETMSRHEPSRPEADTVTRRAPKR